MYMDSYNQINGILTDALATFVHNHPESVQKLNTILKQPKSSDELAKELFFSFPELYKIFIERLGKK